MYVDSEYAESRLHGTLVRLGTRPVIVREVSEDLTCYVKDAVSGDRSVVHLDELNLKSPPLGFVNKEGGCVYLSRKPMRNDWRQGVRPNSIIANNGEARTPSLGVIASCILGEFPKLSVALRHLREGATGVAISRDFKLTRKGSSTFLSYKWYGVVGKLTSKGAVFDSKWLYLEPVFKGVV